MRLALLALCSFSLWAQAQSTEQFSDFRRPSVRATAEATVTASPDRAIIEIGVVSQAQTAQTAAAQNAKRLDEVLKELTQLVGSAGTIKTISYSVRPDYRYPGDGGKPTIVGYTATNMVEATLDNLDLTGKVVDAATRTGANTINGLQFTLKNDQPARTEALEKAARQARAKANALAAALGVKVVGVLWAEENSPGAIPMMREFASARMAEAAPVQTPVEPGTIEIRATVSLALEVSP